MVVPRELAQSHQCSTRGCLRCHSHSPVCRSLVCTGLGRREELNNSAWTCRLSVSHSPAVGVAVLPLGDVPLPPQHHSLERTVGEKRDARSLWCDSLQGWSTSTWRGFGDVWEAGMAESFAILCSPTRSLGFSLSHTQIFLAPALRGPLALRVCR